MSLESARVASLQGTFQPPPVQPPSQQAAQFASALQQAQGPVATLAAAPVTGGTPAGAPLGDAGQGFGRVDDVWAWAERSGNAIPAGSGHLQPGDLIVWDEHIGIVDKVGADGSIRTVEGNSSDSVAQRSYGSDGGGGIGFVRIG